MPAYFEYTLKASLCLAIIFIFYTALLKQITYYTWNRYFLLIFSILSFIVPFINVNVFIQARHLNTSLINQIPLIHTDKIPLSFTNNGKQFDYWQILSAAFILISSILLVRLLIQLLSIRKIRSKATLMLDGEVKVYNLSEPTLPFSFFNSIFINKDNYSNDEFQDIIGHEWVHVQQKHTLDVLITEIICILNWYNPFAWLIKNAVRENLEFVADDAVIRKGVNKKNYQYLLLKVTGDIPLSIASSFTFSSLKKRILMINKTKTSRFHLLKFTLLVPIIIVLLLAFRNQNGVGRNAADVKISSEETFTLSALSYSIPDTKVKALVLKEQDKCFLKPGEIFNLTMVYNEKNRLKSLLEKNGYSSLKSNAIRFFIDTASANNSFSVEIHINAETPAVSSNTKRFGSFYCEIISSDCNHSWYPEPAVKANTIQPSLLNNLLPEIMGYAYSNNIKTTHLI